MGEQRCRSGYEDSAGCGSGIAPRVGRDVVDRVGRRGRRNKAEAEAAHGWSGM